MPIPTPSPVMRVRLIHESGTTNLLGSRFFLAYTDASAPSIADLNSMATFISTTWNAQLAGLLNTSALLFSVIIDDLASATGNQGVDTTTHAGTRAGAVYAQDAVMQLNFKIARHYRGGKPKVYLPYGVTPDATSQTQWSSTFTNLSVSAWNAFIAAISGHTSGGLTAGGQVSVSYYKGPVGNTNKSPWARKNVPAPRGTPVVDPVIGVSGSRFIVTLRKRLGRP